jgi:hypothetical protein
MGNGGFDDFSEKFVDNDLVWQTAHLADLDELHVPFLTTIVIFP